MKVTLYKLLRPVGKRVIPFLAGVWITLRQKTRRLPDKPNVIVLSLGTIGNSASVAKAAKAQGYNVHVFCQEAPFREAPYLDVWHRLDCRSDFDKALTLARSLAPKAILIAEKNLLLPMQAHLADALGLRSVGSLAAQTSNSKIAFREALDAAGVPQLPWCRLDDYTADRLTLPAVLKPDCGTASKGVRYVAKDADLELDPSYTARMSQDPSVSGPFLLESYVEGRQFDVEGLARDGKYHVLTIVEEKYQDTPPYFPPCWFLFNPPIPEELRQKLIDHVTQALNAVGVINGAWHCEVRVDRDGRVRVLDYANRMGYNQFVSHASGVGFADSYVALMCDPDFKMPTPEPRSLMRFLSRDKAETAALARLRRRRIDAVVLPNFMPFEFSYHQYFAMIGILQPDFTTLAELLRHYGVMPDEWHEIYHLPRGSSDA